MTLLHPALYHYLFTQGLIAPLSLKNKKKTKKTHTSFKPRVNSSPYYFRGRTSSARRDPNRNERLQHTELREK